MIFQKESRACEVKLLDLGVAIAAEDDLRQSPNAAIRVFQPDRVA
eukprot:CAMPEP_0115560926 /NCGR_PEP_ID=MMETSP0271-20121206/100722_1 /TAXON_ID=71861 /ORGANISM="Scrippsiella trochoidea, Strain CCMP3099" /LENGTH=44 /DNA_ID= /DNA_START= /DNA_END= /DNA_ORIENTATION=